MTRTPEDAKACKAIRRFCLDCQGGLSRSVRDCADDICALYPWRLPQDATEAAPLAPELQPDPDWSLRPMRCSRRYCITCAGDKDEARRCTAEDCTLWPYRFGVAPATHRRVLQRLRSPTELWLPGMDPRS